MNFGANKAKKAWHVICVRLEAFNKANDIHVCTTVNNMKRDSHIKATHA